MKLTKTDCKIRCEMGACKNFAAFTVRPDRVGVYARIHLCRECLSDLVTLGAAALEEPAAKKPPVETSGATDTPAAEKPAGKVKGAKK